MQIFNDNLNLYIIGLSYNIHNVIQQAEKTSKFGLHTQYKTSGKPLQQNGPCTYEKNTSSTGMRKIDMYSIILNDIVGKFAIPREGHRKLTKLINAMIQETPEPKILQGPATEDMIKIKLASALNGDNSTECPQCKEPRDQRINPRTKKPKHTIKLLSVLIANEKTRQELQYRAGYDRSPSAEANRQNQVMTDFFDGGAYQQMRQDGKFANDNDIACSIYTDGFANTKRCKKKYIMMIHMVILNYDRRTRFRQTYHIQLGIVASNRSICLNSFLCPILSELHYLERFGMVVKKPDGFKEFAKCYLTSGVYLPYKPKPNNAPLRTKADYEDRPTHGITGVSLLSKMDGSQDLRFYAKDELHTIARGVGSLVLDLLMFDADPKLKNYSTDRYPFFIPKATLVEIENVVDATRKHVPISFQGSFLKDLITTLQGVRAVDICDYFLHCVPNLCSIALSWEVTTVDLDDMDACFEEFFRFCNEQITLEQLPKSVYTPLIHYLTHLSDTIWYLGPMPVYSCRSLERSIGQFKTLMTAKINDQAQPSNLVEKVMVRSLLSHSLDVAKAANVAFTKKEDSSDWFEHDEVTAGSNRQLWRPFKEVELFFLNCVY
ncbi:hypothetical protein V8B55DRAFT_1561725 [Mucor lusitanicus]